MSEKKKNSGKNTDDNTEEGSYWSQEEVEKRRIFWDEYFAKVKELSKHLEKEYIAETYENNQNLRD